MVTAVALRPNRTLAQAIAEVEAILGSLGSFEFR